jgi:hypothetical protein
MVSVLALNSGGGGGGLSSVCEVILEGGEHKTFAMKCDKRRLGSILHQNRVTPYMDDPLIRKGDDSKERTKWIACQFRNISLN